MAIEFTLNDPVNNDQTSGEQSSGMPDGFDTNDTDVTVASLDGGLTLSFYDRLVALGLIVEPLPNDPLSFAEDTYAASQLDSVEVTPSGDGAITSVGFTGEFDDVTETAPALDVFEIGVTAPASGDPTGLMTVDEQDIYLFRDEDVADGGLGDKMVYGVAADGTVVFTVFMVYDSSDGTIDLHQVTYGAIFHGEPSNDDEEVDLNDYLTVSASEERTFDFNDLPSGQNLFGIVGDLNEQLIIMPEDPDINDPGNGEFTNQSETTNTSKGGGPVTIGNSNQMIDPGEGFFFYYVTGANPDYIAGQPGGLDQNEADDADNVDLLAGADTIDVDSAFFDVVQTQGNSAAAVTVTAYLLPDTGGTPQEQREFTNNVDSESGLGTAGVDIIKVQVFGIGDTVNPIEEAVFVGGSSVTTIGGGDTAITITINSDGTAEVTGLDAGMRVKWFTDGLHNLSLVHGEAGKFDIGQFGINQPSGKAASIGDNVIWDDDAPVADLDDNGTMIVLDESDGDGDDDGPGGVLADVTTAIADLYDDTSVFGTDGELLPDGKTYSLVLDVDEGTTSGLTDTFTNELIYLYWDGDDIVGLVGSGGSADPEGAEAIRIIVSNDPDTVQVIQSRAVKHNDPDDPDESSSPESIDPDKVLLQVTVTDGDLDEDSDPAELGALINIEDDGPAQSGSATLPLEEDDIDIAGVNGNDSDGTDGEGDGSGLRETRKVTLDSTNIFSGVDQPVSFSIDGDTDPDDVMPTLLSQGLEVHWEAVTGGATEYVRGYTNIDTSRELIIELALTDNGDGTAEAVITVYGQLDHAVEGGGGTENTLLQVAGGGTVSSVDFTPTLEIADGDGDIVPLNPGFLNATDTDDIPEIQGPATDPGIVDFITGNSIDNEDLRGSVGSDGNDSSDENYDGQKTYTFSFPSDVNSDGFFDANDTITSTSIADLEAELSADGTTITYFVDGFGGGAVDGTWEAGERFFDIVLGDQGGSGDYTFNVYQGAPPAFTEFDFEDLPSGQNLHGTIANDLSDPTIGGLLLLPEGTVLDPADGEFTNQSQTTNTSKGGGPVTIGNTNQMFDPGEGHFFAYVSDTDPAMVAGAGLDQNNADDADTVQFGGMDAVTTAQVEIVQVQGNSPATINIKAYDVDYDEFADDGGDPTLIDTNAESRAFVEDPTQHLVDVDGDGTDGQTDPKVISISVYDTDLLDAAADPSTVTPLYTVDIGDGDIMGVTWEGDGSVTVAGLGDDLTVEFTTDVPHDMSLVSNVVGKYDLGGFNLLQIDETPDQLFDYTVDITDFDGDMASDSFQVLVDGTGKFDDGVFDLDPAEV